MDQSTVLSRLAPGDTVHCLQAELRRLEADNERLRAREANAIGYIRDKVDQLLRVIGTLPLLPEELDDDTLISLDPIGIVSDAFEQVLEHLKDTGDDRAQARDQLQAIFDSAGAAIVVIDRERRIQAYNATGRDLFFPASCENGYEDGTDILGRPLPDHHHDPATPHEECLFNRIMSTRSIQEQGDFVFRGRHFHKVGTPILDQHGAVARIVFVYTDITAQKASEQALREAEARLQTIVNTVQSGILLIDPRTHTIVDANAVAVQMIGEERDKLIGSVCHKYVCPAERDQCPITDLRHVLDNTQRVLLSRGRRPIPILKTATTVVLNGREHILESFIDITERKQAEDALRESEERYRSLYSNMREGLALHELIYDEAGKAVDYIALDVNPAYERILGIARDRAVGTRATELYGAGAAPFLEVFAKVVATREPTGFETAFEPMKRFFNISVVSPAPGQFATIFEDITERRRAEDEVQALAYFDTLTGLPNRTLLQDRLSEALLRADRRGDLVGVLFLDLDRFKPINDTMGHAVGDLLLQGVASRLRTCLRKTDTVARLGGDEFVVVIPGIQRELDLTVVVHEIQESLSRLFDIDGREIYTSSSIGITLYPVDGRDASTLLRNADMAMYVAKEHGPSAYQFYSAEMNRCALERLELENSLRQAIKRQEFFLHFQPQVDLAEGRITGVEALLRWSHPQRGLIPPDRFIGVLEETGLILDVGEWVLRTACAQGRAWLDAGLPPLCMAVNLSVKQFQQPGLVDMVARVLSETGLPPARLELELTESMIMEHGEETVRKLHALKEMGVYLAIDDFGTGYSSLGYLKNFPIDRIKIAQIFVRDIPVDPGDAAIVETILAMARSLGLEVIAEGVETREQFDFLRSRQCGAMQGFYFSRPIPADALIALLQAGLGKSC